MKSDGVKGVAMNIGRNQFGFRKGCGTRDAIGVMRMVCERSLEFGNNVYICFVDFEKAFDRVNWEKMMKVLQSIGEDWRDRRMISELYMNQEAVIRIAGGEADSGIIEEEFNKDARYLPCCSQYMPR